VVDLHKIASQKLRRTMMAGFRFPSLSVSLSFKRVIAPVAAALALLAALPQAWGVVPTFTVANTTFPTTTVGMSATQNVTVTVNTAVPITSISIASGFTEYSISSISGCTVSSSGTTTVGAGSVCTIAVKYSPAAPGSSSSPALGRNAPMLVSDIESGNPVTYAFGLTGSATAAVSQLEPATLSLFAGAPLTGLPAPAQGLGVTTAGYGGNNGPANEAVFSFSSFTPPAGCSPYALTQPIARDSAGNIYVIDPGNLVIRKIDNTTEHNVTVVAGTQGKGNTTATFNNAYLDTPSGIAVDAAGNIYFLDTTACYGGFGLVRRVDAVSGVVTSVAGQNFTGTYNSAAGGGTCTGSTGSPGYSWECGDGGLASYANIAYAAQLAIDTAGNLYVWEAAGGGYIRKIDISTGLISTIASAAQLGVTAPEGGMTLAADGNFYVSVDTGTQTYIEQFNPNTQAVTQIAGGGKLVGSYCSVSAAQAGYAASNMFLDGTLSASGDLSSDGAGNIYVDEGLCDGTGDILDDAAAVWRINLATGNAFLEAKAAPGGGAEVGYDSYYGYVTDPRSAVSDSLGNLYFITYNQIALLAGTSGALNFTSAYDYTTQPQTLTATYANVGNAAEPNPGSSFAVGTNFIMNSTADAAACSAITDLAVGATCNLDVEFTPVQAGALTDTVNLTDDGGGMVGLIDNDQTVLLNGTGVAQAYITYSPKTEIAFPNTVVGSTSAPQAVTITNSGTANMIVENPFTDGGSFAGFAVDTTTPGTCSTTGNTTLDPGDSCTVNVTFTPTSATTFTEYLYVNNTSANSPSLVATEFTGTGITSVAPTATLTGISFGSVAEGTTSAAMMATLTNTSTSAAMTISGITVTGTNKGDFTLTTGTNACGTSLAASSNCLIYATFKPSIVGGESATLNVADNATGSPQTSALTGTGATAGAPIATLTPALAFTATQFGQGTQLQATLSNTGTAPLTNIAATVTGANGYVFKIYPNGSCYGVTTLAANAQCTISVDFYPPGPGYFAAVLSVSDNAAGSPQTSILTGEGTEPALQFAPGQLDFVAGTPGKEGATGSGPASAALIGGGYGIALDSTGLLYFSDYDNNTVWQIDDNGNINVFAGTPVLAPGHGSYSGDGGGAASATLDAPEQIAFDPSGNLYIADRFNNLIRVVDSAGNINTFAGSYGNGFGGYAGDGGPANEATLSDPQGVTSDPQGNIYIADTGNFVIRKVDLTGKITLYAGTPGTSGYSGDKGPATSATLGQCYQLATDANGNLYIADFSNGVVRKVDSGGTITTYAGGGTAQVTATPQSATAVNLNNGPVGLATDPGGNLYVLGLGETNEPGVFVVNAGQQIYQIVGGGATFLSGNAANAEFTDLNAIAVDASGDLFVDDAFQNVVSEVGPNGELVFPNTPVNTASAPLSVLITNTGNAPLSFANQNEDGVRGKQVRTARGAKVSAQRPRGDVVDFGSYGSIAGPFEIASGGTCNFDDGIAAGASCTMNVTFNPTATGAATGSIFLYTSSGTGGSNSNEILLSGTGTAGTTTTTATLSPNPLAFGGQEIGTISPAGVVTLSNTGSAGLTGITPTLTGTNASAYAMLTSGTNVCGATLAAGATCNIYVTFTPSATGSLPATLSVADSASGSPQTVSLTGTGVQFQSNVGVATSAQAVSVYFATGGTLKTIQVLTQGIANLDFTVASGGTCATGTAYTAGESCTVDVVFTPQAPGARNGSILLSDASSNVLGTAYLPGIGYGPEIAFYPGVQSTLPSYSKNGYSAPLGVSVDAALNVYVADTLNNQIIRIPQSASGFGTPIKLPAIGLNQPSSVAIDGNGNVFIADTKNFQVVELPWNGTSYGTQVVLDASALPDPDGIAVDGNGNVYFADGLDQKLVEVPWTGAGYGAPVTIAQATGLHSPHGVAIDATGDVFIADSDNSRVVELPWTSSGFGTEVVLATGLFYPEAVAVDGGGDVYIGNSNAASVIELPWNGSTFGTQIVLPFTGLSNSDGVAVDANGNIYVADGGKSDAVMLNVSNPPTLSFAATNVGATSSDSPKTVTAYNIGNVDLYFYAQDNNPVYPVNFPENMNDNNLCEEDNSVDQGGSCDVSVNFTPTASGNLSGFVVLTDNNLVGGASLGGGVTQSIAVNGKGVSTATPVATLSPALAFPNTNTGTTSAALIATLSNTGGATLNISGIAVGGTNSADFAIGTGSNACGTTLAADASCSIYVTFTPASAASFSATLTVTDNASPTTQSVTLSGTGTSPAAPIASLTPSSLTFTTVSGTTSASQTAMLSNSGNATLNITSIAIGGTNSGDFTVTTGSNACGETLAADASCIIYVTFSAPSVGSFTATLTVTDNANPTTQSTTLNGTGTAPPDFNISATPTTQSVAAGAAATYTVTLNSTNGSFEPEITLSASGLPPGATASFAPAQVSVSDGSAASTLTIQTAGGQLAQSRTSIWPLATPALALLFLLPMRRWRKAWKGKLMLVVVGLVSLASAMTLMGCGGGFALVQPSQTYTITITGTGGTDTHTTTVQLTVQ
jgi:trimeric autotransporter adhesin